eukprot:gene1926-2361_t
MISTTDKIEIVSTKFGGDVFSSIKKIRYDVFVVEQECPEDEEWDEYDEHATHLLLKVNDVPVGASRYRKIYYPKYDGKLDTDVLKLERFAILKEFRGKNYGSELVKLVIKEAYVATNKQYPYFIINAQQYVEKFYSKLGFVTDTSIPIFYEANIPHVRMTLSKETIESMYFQN